jgi:hypothetical protein
VIRVPRNALIAGAATCLLLAVLAVSQALPGVAVVVLLLAALLGASLARKAEAEQSAPIDAKPGGSKANGDAAAAGGPVPPHGPGAAGGIRLVPDHAEWRQRGRQTWRDGWSRARRTGLGELLARGLEYAAAAIGGAVAAARGESRPWRDRFDAVRDRRGDPATRHGLITDLPPAGWAPTGGEPEPPAAASSPPPFTADPSPDEPRSRRWDGEPETEADRRFFDARDSGYLGWIDSDGYRLTDEQARALWESWGAGERAAATDPTARLLGPPLRVAAVRLDQPAALGTAPSTRSDGTFPSTDPKETDMAGTVTAINPTIGTGGRGGIAGLIVDWQSSVDARQHPETFVAWLLSQAATADQAASMVPDLAEQFHGRGPTGHAGVPASQLAQFAAAFAEARHTEAAAYRAWAVTYQAYVAQAEHDLTHTYGREVLSSSTAAHRG